MSFGLLNIQLKTKNFKNNSLGLLITFYFDFIILYVT